jgi:hypothetical protein
LNAVPYNYLEEPPTDIHVVRRNLAIVVALLIQLRGNEVRRKRHRFAQAATGNRQGCRSRPRTGSNVVKGEAQVQTGA